MAVVLSRNFTVFLWWNDCFRFLRFDMNHQYIGIIPLVGHDSLGFKTFYKRSGLRNIRNLATSQNQSNGIPQGVSRSVNFRCQASTGTSDGLWSFFFWAPAACWCVRTMVLSKNRHSKSGSSENFWAIRAHKPFSLHLAKRLYTLCHLPNDLGRSRQGEPVRAIHSTASKKSLLSLDVTPQSLFFPEQRGSNRSHWSSRKINLSMGPP